VRVAGVEKYHIYYKARINDDWRGLATPSATSSSFEYSTKYAYYYCITAENSAGESSKPNRGIYTGY
jgi:hypothetical protein